MTYEAIKTWCQENKEKIIVGVCFALVFIVGFGTGRYEREIRRNVYKPQNNYTTAASKKPLPAAGQPALRSPGVGVGTVLSASTTPTASCIVKGNISTGGKKIYHVQGGAFYNKVKAEMCFKTEAEALAAGFVKSGR